MQKSNKNASILIWATFLSLIISVTFIWISTSINKNLKNNSNLTNQFKIENEINNAINNWVIDRENVTNFYLSNWDKFIYEKTNKKKISLKKTETSSWKILYDSNITIKIINWWPVYYKYKTSSWLVVQQETFSETASWTFTITNLWWYTKLFISSDRKWNMLSKYRKYYIYKKIWNKEVLEKSWKIKNF